MLTRRPWPSKVITRFLSFRSQKDTNEPCEVSAACRESLIARLRSCVSKNHLCQGKRLHDYIAQIGLLEDRFVCNLLVQMYGKCGTLQDARNVFDSMLNRNSFSWNIMIGAYVERGQLKEALELFEQMPCKNTVSWTSMVTAYAKQGMLKQAMELFQQMPHKDAVSWTTMITAFAQKRQLKEALELFTQMPVKDVVSWNAIIAAHVQMGCIKEALNLFDQMQEQDVVSWNLAMCAYSQQGKVEEALQLFNRIPKRDHISWNTIIGAYGQQGQIQEMLQLFERMLQGGILPNEATFTTVLDACSHNAALVEGKYVHLVVMEHGYELHIVVSTVLINMYAKSGSLSDVHMLFDIMPQRGVIPWTAMVAAYAQHGHVNEAFKIFDQMYLEGVHPNAITVCNILSACRHAGTVHKGYHLFASMSHNHSITRTLEHYTYVIDSLGRAEGLLDEAEDFIRGMPFEPDATSWTTLLDSCKTSGDFERATRVAKHVFLLDPESAAPYVILSNMVQDYT